MTSVSTYRAPVSKTPSAGSPSNTRPSFELRAAASHPESAYSVRQPTMAVKLEYAMADSRVGVAACIIEVLSTLRVVRSLDEASR